MQKLLLSLMPETRFTRVAVRQSPPVSRKNTPEAPQQQHGLLWPESDVQLEGLLKGVGKVEELWVADEEGMQDALQQAIGGGRDLPALIRSRNHRHKAVDGVLIFGNSGPVYVIFLQCTIGQSHRMLPGAARFQETLCEAVRKQGAYCGFAFVLPESRYSWWSRQTFPNHGLVQHLAQFAICPGMSQTPTQKRMWLRRIMRIFGDKMETD